METYTSKYKYHMTIIIVQNDKKYIIFPTHKVPRKAPSLKTLWRLVFLQKTVPHNII